MKQFDEGPEYEDLMRDTEKEAQQVADHSLMTFEQALVLVDVANRNFVDTDEIIRLSLIRLNDTEILHILRELPRYAHLIGPGFIRPEPILFDSNTVAYVQSLYGRGFRWFLKILTVNLQRLRKRITR